MARMNKLQVTSEAISVFKELNVVKPETVHTHLLSYRYLPTRICLFCKSLI